MDEDDCNGNNDYSDWKPETPGSGNSWDNNDKWEDKQDNLSNHPIPITNEDEWSDGWKS